MRKYPDTPEPPNDRLRASCSRHAENSTLGVTCWSTTPASSCACVLPAAGAWSHVLGRERSSSGCFLSRLPPKAAGALGGSDRSPGLESWIRREVCRVPSPRRGETWDGGGDGVGWGRAGRCVLPRGSGVPRLRLSSALGCPLLSPSLRPAPIPPARCPWNHRLGVSDLVFSLSLLTHCPRSVDGPPFTHDMKSEAWSHPELPLPCAHVQLISESC